ncbi:hypothetical protein TNCV_3760361 [Trichonephila clavipes]|nr:hypothetical protein TNCV_3760361 [Trichonephila clavipes]
MKIEINNHFTLKELIGRPTDVVVSDADCGAVGTGRRAASPLVWLMEGVERWEAPAQPRCPPSKLGWKRAKSYCHLYGAESYD